MAGRLDKENLKKTIDAVIESTEQTLDAMAEAAEETCKKVDQVLKEAIGNNPGVAEAMKETKEAFEKMEKAVGEAVEETKEAAKKTVRKAAGKPKQEEPVIRTYLQYLGKEINHADILLAVYAKYEALGGKREEITELNLYIKPEDNAVYYVINGSETGKIYI